MDFLPINIEEVNEGSLDPDELSEFIIAEPIQVDIMVYSSSYWIVMYLL